MKKCIIILTIIIVTMFVMNPSELDFKEYIENDVKIQLNEQNISDVEEVNSLLTNVIGHLAGKTIPNFVTRKDYHLFSIFTIDVLGEKIKYVGVFKRFFPLISH